MEWVSRWNISESFRLPEPHRWEDTGSSKVTKHHQAPGSLSGQPSHPGSGRVQANRSGVVGGTICQNRRNSPDRGWNQSWLWPPIIDG